jgi:hypothetical protein
VIRKSEYDGVVAGLTAAGFFHSFRIDPRFGYQMICVSGRQEDGSLYGKSFWLSRSANQKCWLIFNWGGARCWRIPEDSIVVAVCLSCLREMDPCMDVPDSVAEKYGLVEIDPKTIKGFDFADCDETGSLSNENEVVLVAMGSDGTILQRQSMSYEEYCEEAVTLWDDSHYRAKLGIRKVETQFNNNAGDRQATYEHYYDTSGEFERGRNTYADGTVTDHVR